MMHLVWKALFSSKLVNAHINRVRTRSWPPEGSVLFQPQSAQGAVHFIKIYGSDYQTEDCVPPLPYVSQYDLILPQPQQPCEDPQLCPKDRWPLMPPTVGSQCHFMGKRRKIFLTGKGDICDVKVGLSVVEGLSPNKNLSGETSFHYNCREMIRPSPCHLTFGAPDTTKIPQFCCSKY